MPEEQRLEEATAREESPRDASEQLLAVHEQLLARDNAFRFWDAELRARDEKIDALSAENLRLKENLAELNITIRSMQEARVWRLAERYRDLRRKARRWFPIQR